MVVKASVKGALRATACLAAVAVAVAFCPVGSQTCLNRASCGRSLVVRQGLLKGIDPLLTADLLGLLRAAGHGDVIAVVDVNFPAVEVASKTTTGELVQLAGVNGPDALSAITSVMPIDFFVEDPLYVMVPSPGLELPPAGEEVHEAAKQAVTKHCPAAAFLPLDRFSFYEQARDAFAVVQTSERRPYGCFLLQKGVVGPDGNDLLP